MFVEQSFTFVFVDFSMFVMFRPHVKNWWSSFPWDGDGSGGRHFKKINRWMRWKMSQPNAENHVHWSLLMASLNGAE